MVEYWDRLKPEMDAKGLSISGLAKALGITFQAVAKVRDGGSFGTDNHLKAARLFGLNPEWLSSGKGAKHVSGEPHRVTKVLPGSRALSVSDSDDPDQLPVRRVAIKAQAGVSGYGVEYVPDDGRPISFRADWYKAKGFKHNELLACRVTGDSMIPNLYEDDIIVINTQSSTPKDTTAFLVDYEGEIVVKRLIRDDGQWWLTSDNPDQRRYPRRVCHEQTQIIGEVVYRQTERV